MSRDNTPINPSDNDFKGKANEYVHKVFFPDLSGKTAIQIYLHIFIITTATLIGGYILAAFLRVLHLYFLFPTLLSSAGILASTALGIVLPLKWQRTQREKLLTILLLPTNYTIIINILVSIAAIMFIGSLGSWMY